MPPTRGPRTIVLRGAADYDSDCFNTPAEVAEAIGYVDTDPCSNEWSHIRSARSYSLDEGEDGLVMPWEGIVFSNPPFSDTLPWIRRCLRHAQAAPGNGAIVLIKMDPTTEVYRLLYNARAKIYPFRDRVPFTYHGQDVGSASFPCIIATLGVEASPALKRLCYPPIQRGPNDPVIRKTSKRLLKSRAGGF